jgi:flagellar hook-basal body complex protein FliE
MPNPINGFTPPLPLFVSPAAPGEPAQQSAGVPFRNLLADSLKETGALEQAAQSAVERSLAGGDVTQAEVLMSMKKADLALRMMLQVRNKLLDAYEEIKQLRM